jgi:hypothetical protein
MDPESVVTLNVGGFVFVTRRSTLLESNCFFAGLAQHHPDCAELFVDRDATHFRHVLNWMRGVRGALPEEECALRELQCEAEFYAMTDLVRAIQGTRRYSLARAVHELAHTMRTAR